MLYAGISKETLEHLLIELAEFHASSYHYLQKIDMGIEEIIEKHVFLTPRTMFYLIPDMVAMQKENMSTCLNSMGMIVKKEGLEQLGEKVLNQKPGAVSAQKKAGVASDSCKFKTLIHGDYWYNNFMLK